jgi:hypothetical protein
MRVMNVTDIRYGGVVGQVVAAVICLVGCSRSSVSNSGHESLTTNRRQQEAKPSLALERVRVMVPLGYTNCAHGGVLIERNLRSPPPWQDGNSLTFTFWKATVPGQVEERAYWYVVNMHAENYFEITRRLKMSSVEVHVLHTGKSPERVQEVGQPERTLDNGYAVVTDPRIPREWYRSEPVVGNTSLDWKTAQTLRAAYPESFRASD